MRYVIGLFANKKSLKYSFLYLRRINKSAVPLKLAMPSYPVYKHIRHQITVVDSVNPYSHRSPVSGLPSKGHSANPSILQSHRLQLSVISEISLLFFLIGFFIYRYLNPFPPICQPLFLRHHIFSSAPYFTVIPRKAELPVPWNPC